MRVHSQTQSSSRCVNERINEHGSVFYIIMLGIVLFAAISTVVVQSGKGGTSAISDEKAEIYAAELIQYGASVAAAAKRIQMVNECTDEQISFETPDSVTYDNPNAPDDERCHVFDVNGGRISYTRQFENKTLALEFSGTTEVKDIGSTCAQASCSDLIMTVMNLTSKAVCEKINKKLGVAMVNGDIPKYPGVSSPVFTGAYSYGSRTFGGDAPSITLAGKKAACYFDTNSAATSPYGFYTVLLAR